MRSRAAHGSGGVKLPFHKSGGAGWAILAAVVLAWDASAPETMSAAFARATSTPAGRAMLVLGWGALTAHLFSALPEDKDPVRMAVAALRAATEKAA